jgi:prepilin-type N-terminal cleavage/methylation domain-containing protein
MDSTEYFGLYSNVGKIHNAVEHREYAKTAYRLRGFTLIQLLVVLAIIAIVAALAIPNFTSSRAKLIREFPWPSPRASTFDVISRDLLVGKKETPTLGDVDAALDSAFRQAGYRGKKLLQRAERVCHRIAA